MKESMKQPAEQPTDVSSKQGAQQQCNTVTAASTAEQSLSQHKTSSFIPTESKLSDEDYYEVACTDEYFIKRLHICFRSDEQKLLDEFRSKGTLAEISLTKTIRLLISYALHHGSDSEIHEFGRHKLGKFISRTPPGGLQ
jgi:hypothetical protein